MHDDISEEAEPEDNGRHSSYRHARTNCDAPSHQSLAQRAYSPVLRRCGRGPHQRGPHTIRYAWPSCDWGWLLPIEGDVMSACRRGIEAAPDSATREKEIENMLKLVRNPIRTVEAFGIEEIIDPRDTRPLVVDWARLRCRDLPAQLGPKSRSTRA